MVTKFILLLYNIPPFLFITLSALYGGEWSVSCCLLCPWGKRLPYLLNSRLVESWNLSQQCGVQKNLLHLVRIKPQFLSSFTKNILFLFGYNVNPANWSWRSGSVVNIMVGGITCHLLLPPALLAIIIIVPPLASHFVMAGFPLFLPYPSLLVCLSLKVTVLFCLQRYNT